MCVFMNVCASKCYTQRHTHITHLPGGLLPAVGGDIPFSNLCNASTPDRKGTLGLLSHV